MGAAATPRRTRLAPALRDVGTGIVDFYDVFLPFVPLRNPEMHVLVLCAIFGFTLAASLLVAARRPIGAAAVTVAGVGWPATLGGGNAIAFGTIALSAALAIPLVLRVGSVKTLLAGAAIGALVVLGAATASSGTTLARQPAVDWQNWDLRASAREASSVRFIWDSNYDGISFPPKKTVVLRIDGPQRPYYWRSTTLDLFNQNHWFEDLFWLDQVDDESRALQLPQLVPKRAGDQREWVEQRVRVEALVDDHLVAAGTPVGLDARRFGVVFQLSGGVLRVSDPIRVGQTYRVWSYAPDPAPRALASPACALFGGAVALPRGRRSGVSGVRRPAPGPCPASVHARSVVRWARLARENVRGRAACRRQGDHAL